LWNHGDSIAQKFPFRQKRVQTYAYDPNKDEIRAASPIGRGKTTGRQSASIIGHPFKPYDTPNKHDRSQVESMPYITMPLSQGWLNLENMQFTPTLPRCELRTHRHAAPGIIPKIGARK
jgi:hypothetical protein